MATNNQDGSTETGTQHGIERDSIGRGFRYRDMDPQGHRGRFFQITRDGRDRHGIWGDSYWFGRRFKIVEREVNPHEEEDGLRETENRPRKSAYWINKELLLKRLEERKYVPGWGSKEELITESAAPLTPLDDGGS